MALKFYFGASCSGKSTKMQEEMIARSMQDKNQEFLMIVPDQFTMQTQKEMVERHPAKGIMNIDILSFGRLSYRIFEEVGAEDKIILDDTGKNLVLRKVVSDLADELPVLGSSIRKNGFIQEMKSVISEFMQYGISVQDMDMLTSYCEKKPALKSKLTDLKKVYEGFIRYIEEKYVTTEETLEVLAKALYRSERIKNSIVAFDGFTGFTPIQNRVILALLELCDEVWFSITIDASALANQKEQLFSLSYKTITSLEKLAKQAGTSRLEDVCLPEPVVRYEQNPELSHLERNIFRYPQKNYSGACKNIQMFVADSPLEEFRQVCLKVRNLVKNEGYAYRDIAIVTGALERYSPYADELFRLYEIPGFVDTSRKLVLNPFTEYVKSGLEIIARDFSYESMMHFLRSGLTGISDDEIDKVDNYLLALGIRGRNKWVREFVRCPSYMKEWVEQEQKVTEKSLEELGKINSSREQIMEILAPLLKLKRKSVYSAKEITLALYEYICANKVFDKLNEYTSAFKKKGDFAGEKEYAQIYRYLMELLEQICTLLGNEEVALEDYIHILEAGISEITIGVLPQNVDYVVLGDIERTRLKQVKALFFMGVNDGVIPKSTGNGGMISDIDREFLQGAGFELAPTPRQKMYIQRLYLYMNMTKPTTYLTISYARMDSEGHSVRPAYLIDMVKRLYPQLSVERTENLEITEQISGKEDGIRLLASLLREYAADTLMPEEKKVFYTLYEEYEKELPEKTKALTQAAFYRYEQKPLRKELVKALYGAMLENSISRLEQFAGCAYSHFLNYGMNLAEREDFVFSPPDVGNIFHTVLEQFGNVVKERGLSWAELKKEEAEGILTEIIQMVASGYSESILYQDARTAYQLEKMKRVLLRAVMNIGYQIKKGTFEPRYLEVKFRHIIDVSEYEPGLTEEEKMVIKGKIDRVDIAEDEEHVYVKVVDYKTGGKRINFVELYHGLQLQLVVYLNQAVLREQKRHPDKEVVPAAMFYYPVTDPLIEEECRAEAEEVSKWITQQLRQSGLFLEKEEVVHGLDEDFETVSDVVKLERKKDGSYKALSDTISAETMNLLMHYANRKVIGLGKEILAGNKSAVPCGDSVCGYCPYSEICQFDSRIPGYERKGIKKGNKEEILQMMQEELEQDG